MCTRWCRTGASIVPDLLLYRFCYATLASIGACNQTLGIGFWLRNRLTVPNPDLKPESLWSYDPGINDALELYAVVDYTRGAESDDQTMFSAARIPPLNGWLGLV